MNSKDMRNTSKKISICSLFTTNLSNKKKTDFQNCLNIIKKRKPDALWTVSKIDKKFNPIKQLILKEVTKIF